MGNGSSAEIKKFPPQERDRLADSMKGKVSHEEINFIVNTFKGMSGVNKKTYLDIAKQLATTFQINGVNPDNAETTFELFDQNHDGVVDVKDFAQGIHILRSGTEEERALLSFRALDRDGDGFISRSELQSRIQHLLKLSTTQAKKEGQPQNTKKESGSGDLNDVLARQGEAAREDQMDAQLKPYIDRLNEILGSSLVDNMFLTKKISKDQWSVAAKANSNLIVICDPYQSTHLFKGAHETVLAGDPATLASAMYSDGEVPEKVEKKKGDVDEVILQKVMDNTGLKINCAEARSKNKKK
eukprot:TRINITY_DN3373_c0_g1_i1.p1 TRINITY_DN3373_c0_g1~~TRINITY_DN3373_c0_g1_i1.p1  ORF type:complete len:299 (-),score=77.56 TRINITY_DN3373_c0_g1_i1:237-1133(-)